MMFFRKKKLNSEEFEQTAKRMSLIEADNTKIITLMNSLRGLVNRKLGISNKLDLDEPISEEIPEEKTEEKESPDGLDSLRMLNREEQRRGMIRESPITEN